MQALIEQRKDSRSSVAWPISVWLPQANRFVIGRSCNISKTGVYITLPVTAPIRTGHLVELNFPRTEALAKEKGQFARIKSGKIDEWINSLEHLLVLVRGSQSGKRSLRAGNGDRYHPIIHRAVV